MDFIHRPVLVHEAVDMLNCAGGGIFVDCTVGGGGHAEAILEKLDEGGKLIGIDCDETALETVRERLGKFGTKLILRHGNFIDIREILKELGIEAVDGILFDLGISSSQLDDPNRGFSFRNDGLLDMRMDRSQSLTAGEIVNSFSESEIADLLWNYGEERKSRRIAKSICEFRKSRQIRTTKELADIAAGACRYRGRIHPATRTFQALRIAVNSELRVLQSVLERAVSCLPGGGRICVISYHSLEDRIVKNEFRRFSKPACGNPKVTVLTKKPIVPSREEVLLNRRSRSAKMRAAERVL